MAEAPYDRIAAEFARDIDAGSRADFRAHVMYPSVLRATGDVAGSSILDLACGTGVYARLLRKLSAARVVGVDISTKMIDIARAYQHDPAITYLVHDVAQLPVLGAFDVAVAATLLNFAQSRRALERMYERIRANLRTGGRLVALMQNAELDPRTSVIDQFGMHQHGHRSDDGSAVLVDLGEPPETVTTWSWWPTTHEQLARMAGFTALKWWPHVNIAEPGHPHYTAFQQYLGNPHMVILTAEAE